MYNLSQKTRNEKTHIMIFLDYQAARETSEESNFAYDNFLATFQNTTFSELLRAKRLRPLFLKPKAAPGFGPLNIGLGVKGCFWHF